MEHREGEPTESADSAGQAPDHMQIGFTYLLYVAKAITLNVLIRWEAQSLFPLYLFLVALVIPPLSLLVSFNSVILTGRWRHLLLYLCLIPDVYYLFLPFEMPLLSYSHVVDGAGIRSEMVWLLIGTIVITIYHFRMRSIERRGEYELPEV